VYHVYSGMPLLDIKFYLGEKLEPSLTQSFQNMYFGTLWIEMKVSFVHFSDIMAVCIKLVYLLFAMLVI